MANDNDIRVRITGDLSNPRTIRFTDVATNRRIANVLAAHIIINGPESYISLDIFGDKIALEGDARVDSVAGKDPRI